MSKAEVLKAFMEGVIKKGGKEEAVATRELTKADAEGILKKYGLKEGPTYEHLLGKLEGMTVDDAMGFIATHSDGIDTAVKDELAKALKKAEKGTYLGRASRWSLGKAEGVDLKTVIHGVGTYGMYYFASKAFFGANAAQNTDDCKRLCIDRSNHDQTEYAKEASTEEHVVPDPNCPTTATPEECKTYCSTEGDGACTVKNNLKRGEAECSGLGLATCMENAANTGITSFAEFWSAFGPYLTYAGVFLAIILMCVVVYYAAKTFAVTKVGNVVKKAKDKGIQLASGYTRKSGIKSMKPK